MNCKELCQHHNRPCKKSECRYWIDYEDDLNCTLIVVDKHKELTLREIAERLHISFVRVQQIEKKALKKMAKKLKLQNIF
tara:strand:- start:179 stop:418 length:240 start_codon:yes stop_codon:yes gene_type:complete